MTNDDIKNILIMADKNNIEVIVAKRQSDVGLEGLHIVEPTYERILEAIFTAAVFGVKTVVIHSKVHYPYKLDRGC